MTTHEGGPSRHLLRGQVYGSIEVDFSSIQRRRRVHPNYYIIVLLMHI